MFCSPWTVQRTTVSSAQQLVDRDHRRGEEERTRDRPGEVGEAVTGPVAQTEHVVQHDLEPSQLPREAQEVQAVFAEGAVGRGTTVDLGLLAVDVDLDPGDV